MLASPSTHHLAVLPEVESFYHLAQVDVSTCGCQGLACFVARHLSAARWHDAFAGPARVHCLGKCYAAPAHGSDDRDRPAVHVDAREPIVLERIVNGGARTLDAYRRTGGYEALRAAMNGPPSAVIDAVEASGLRGRGGAGFPTGLKWRAAAAQPPGQKCVVANADEGDPGAYIDRFTLEDDPHCLIEAMALAGYAVGASRGYIYLRGEYPAARDILQNALLEARDAGVLEPSVRRRPFAFDIELCVGRGSYLCGEETALLNSIEGKRPVAMARPPYATERGLWGRPTIINNIETLANVPWIVRHGGEAYRSLGFSKSRGTKVLSLNSLFTRPGLYEVEFGVPLRHVIEDLGGGLRAGSLKGVIVGGPLAGIVPPHLLDVPLGFEEMRAIGADVGHGGVVAFDQHTSIAELVHHVFSFGAFESCGKCLPCRLGARHVEQVFGRICATGSAPSGDRAEVQEIFNALGLTSLCGHGTGLAEFAQSVVRYYGDELAACFHTHHHEAKPCPA